MGNFIYIDTNKADYQDEMNQAFRDCLGMASVASTKPKMTFSAPSIAYKETVNVETQYSFLRDDESLKMSEPQDEKNALNKSFEDVPDDAADDDDEMDNEDGDDEKQEKIADDWTSIKYFVSMLVKEKQIKAADMKVQFKLGNIKLQGEVNAIYD